MGGDIPLHSPSCRGALAGAELSCVKQKEQPTPFEIQRQKPGRQTQLPVQQLLLPSVPRRGGSRSPLTTIHLERGLAMTAVPGD